ncbi:hypothetical protein VTP01DRAFT_3540 [Rhizomucor pusillus]|uniref:uncharacterized protein n=1 Tax=Rhizomucor pusillus TaxID=4840 RepID=UPI003743C682
MMSKGSKHGNQTEYLQYCRGWQSSSAMPSLYDKGAIKRLSWDTTKSIQSHIGKAADMILDMIPRNSSRSTVVCFGIDGVSATTTRASQSSMETRLANRITDKARTSDKDIIVARTNEYNTSQICPRCLGQSKKSFVKPMKQPGTKRDIIRIKQCPDQIWHEANMFPPSENSEEKDSQEKGDQNEAAITTSNPALNPGADPRNCPLRAYFLALLGGDLR